MVNEKVMKIDVEGWAMHLNAAVILCSIEDGKNNL